MEWNGMKWPPVMNYEHILMENTPQFYVDTHGIRPHCWCTWKVFARSSVYDITKQFHSYRGHKNGQHAGGHTRQALSASALEQKTTKNCP